MLGLCATLARAQSTPPSQPEPTLDELLGLPRQPDAKPAPSNDPAKAELDRQLRTEEVHEDFEQAVELMGEVSGRLEQARDTGLETQRLQEDILRKLDKLIADAQQSQRQGRSKSKPKPKDDQEQQPGQQSSQQQQPSEGQQPTNQAGDPKAAMQQGRLNAPPASNTASWGNLPPHLREALSQGRSDRFSSLYQQLTEQYYRRLAEDRRSGPGGPR